MTRMSEPLDLTAWMTRWQMFPPPGGLILCAVSGGRDSVCLLDCLWKLGQARDFRVAAAHLNHGMRPTAQRDEDLVRALCAERDIPFCTEAVDVYALCAVWRLTVEETGRRARYDFLRRTADALAADFIATAHHRDDQAETVLLQLLRGTGPQGLTGIPPVRDGIIRPLLDTPRAAIDDYIAQNCLPYVTDETNLDTHYARNRLRLDIMPQLRAINPAAVTHITRTADILIVAIGRPCFVTADMVKEGAVVIDVGTNRIADPTHPKGSRLVGDVDFEAVKEKASYITPVPGGVGPMTICMLMANAVRAAERVVE